MPAGDAEFALPSAGRPTGDAARDAAWLVRTSEGFGGHLRYARGGRVVVT